MARTLIGNIKGKDGRGISKIEKTATTGVVDTYTITYTDGTQSTYELRNSDSIAIQRQIVPSAAIESSTTASQAYAAGDYVVVNGVLRKVKSAIAKGDAISDSNSTATTVTGELATLGDSVSQVVLFDNANVAFDQPITLSQDPSAFARIAFTCITDDNEQLTVFYKPSVSNRFVVSCSRVYLATNKMFFKSRVFEVSGRTVKTASELVSGKKYFHSGQASVPPGSVSNDVKIKIVYAVGYTS